MNDSTTLVASLDGTSLSGGSEDCKKNDDVVSEAATPAVPLITPSGDEANQAVSKSSADTMGHTKAWISNTARYTHSFKDQEFTY